MPTPTFPLIKDIFRADFLSRRGVEISTNRRNFFDELNA